MAALGNFNAQGIAPAEPGLPVWHGRVPVTITKTEIKPTAANDGSSMLVLTVKAALGEYQGQENAIRLNLYNKSPQASEIAQRQLSAICHVTNRMQITDSDQLIGAPFLTVWEKEKRTITDNQTGQQREIEGCQCKDYHVADGRTIRELLAGAPASNPFNPNAPAAHAAPAASQAPQAPAAPPATPAAPSFQPPTQNAGFAPPAAPGVASGGFAPAPHGGQPTPAAPGFGTAASPTSAPAAPFQPPGAPAAGGFGAPAAAPAGFAPPAGPQPGAGPWGAPR